MSNQDPCRARTILLAGSVLLLACGLVTSASAQVIACEKDTDCEVGSICVQGRCKEARCLHIWQPVCGVDGKTYSNRCFARAGHVKVAHQGPCGQVCGGPHGLPCPKSQFCDLPTGKCDPKKFKGECVDFANPDDCPRTWDPVCGCDGKTYANDCQRRVAGVSAQHKCECEISRAECDNDQQCAANEFCEFPPYTCGVHFTGRCVKKPDGPCPDLWDPECGCDLETFPNECERRQAGVSLLDPGECGQRCGPILGLICPRGQVCDIPPGRCDLMGAQGECVPHPEGCPPWENPVCGCDGKQYTNDCWRLLAGVQKDYHGPCIDR